ncbi:RDHE2 dehydrogenase, partial [Nothoprocta pentlandii]|nr:RDHE2 dehydrogenase [Nothoprocta pentlandii]
LITVFFETFMSFIRTPCKKNLAGEIVLVTGAAKGIGRQIALKFASLGTTLVLWDIDEEGNKETSALAQEKGAKGVFAYKCDCSKREEVYEQAEKVRKEVGDVSILVNNAGIFTGKTFSDMSGAEFEKTIRVNFLSQAWTCKAFLPAMIACNHGHLINMSSATALFGSYKTSDYSASKFAIVGMMESIDDELYRAGKDGIKTTIVCPSFVNTDLVRGIQSYNQLFLPVYEADYVASRIVDAVQKEKFYLFMPPTLLTTNCVYLLSFFPRKVVLLFLSYLKLAKSLDEMTAQK